MYNSVKLDKGLYNLSGKSFSEALAELDPDTNYTDTELSGLDAYERQLKRFDIKASGADSSSVLRFSRHAVFFQSLQEIYRIYTARIQRNKTKQKKSRPSVIEVGTFSIFFR